MEADFSGYATKVGLKCSDGRTIMPDAFKHQDKAQVPLVWQHGHKDPENVLGHVILENRNDGVYCRAYFNNTQKATHAKSLVEHEDINSLSIWANQLIERSKRVIHGAIREVSLVLSGANPGALIDNVTIRHSDGEEDVLEDEVIIYTGETIVHSEEDEEIVEDPIEEPIEETKEEPMAEMTHADDGEETVQDVYDSMDQKQKDVLHFMVGEAIAATKDEETQSNTDNAEHGNDKEGSDMSRNVFEDKEAGKPDLHILSHGDVEEIVTDAVKTGSLREAVDNYALSHGIDDIDTLFPEAMLVGNTPEYLQRRTEWVGKVLGSVRKSPFSRIKTLSADITVEEARAKGYVTGALKKEEFFGVTKRVTTPTTVYKKQKLDRDDVVDITDFDVVAWLKAEMRLMLDEEIARAILIGDGRDVAHEDKINEQNVRPIATDHSLFTTVVNVNMADASSTIQEVTDAIVGNRRYYKGTGLPVMFTSETYISKFLLLKDTLGRRIYNNLEEVASELRVSEIVPVEVMEEEPDVVAVLVNPVDYVVGADKGGSISLFDDFDIDYNQYKYLIETRLSGALVKLKAALVVKTVGATDTEVTPAAPTFNGSAVTIVGTTGVVYKDGNGVTVTAASSPYAVAEGESMSVHAEAATGKYIQPGSDSDWTFYNRP